MNIQHKINKKFYYSLEAEDLVYGDTLKIQFEHFQETGFLIKRCWRDHIINAYLFKTGLTKFRHLFQYDPLNNETTFSIKTKKIVFARIILTEKKHNYGYGF